MRKGIFFLMIFIGIVLLFVASVATRVRADYKYDYYSYDELAVLLEDLESQSSLQTPDVYSLHIIGDSHQGNPIYAVKFSDNPEIEEDGEPDIVIDSGIHSKEWTCIETTIKYIEHLFTAYYDDLHPDHTEVVDLVHSFEIWIIPMINPDGRIRDGLGDGGDPCNYWTDPTYHNLDASGWRLNVQDVNCPAKPGGVNIGIDVNRSFSAGFKWYGTGNYTCEGTWYPGPAPLVAHEARVLKQFINNHMVSFVLHQHTSGQIIFTSSETALNISDEIVTMYSDESADPRLLPLINFQTYPFNGQYHQWLFNEIDDNGAPDTYSKRAIQDFNYEVGPTPGEYGVGADGLIGQYERDDGSNPYRISSGEWMEWFISMNVDVYTYIVKQSRYPFSPRYYTDMSRRPDAPETDLALVGAKISEVGTGLPGCFTYGNDGRDLLEPGSKRVTWNVQNNGTSNRTIDSEITICNLSDDPDCLSATTAILTRTDVVPEAIETLTYDYAFPDAGACKDYSVTLSTGESDSYGNDLKRFVFTLTSPSDVDSDGVSDGNDNCTEIRNGPTGGICTSGKVGEICRSDEWCGPPEDPGICSVNQDDTYPPQGNGIGDACDCECDFDCSGGVDANDVSAFLIDFGRSTYNNPCTNASPCNGDVDCNVNVDAIDVNKFLEDFGRSQFFNPCPACVAGDWCVYP
jgi:hypothetical protein